MAFFHPIEHKVLVKIVNRFLLFQIYIFLFTTIHSFAKNVKISEEYKFLSTPEQQSSYLNRNLTTNQPFSTSNSVALEINSSFRIKQENDSLERKKSTFRIQSLPYYTLWEGTVTGLPPLQSSITVPAKAQIWISGDNISGIVNNGPYPNGFVGEEYIYGSIISGGFGQNTMTFNQWGEPSLPWTMTDSTLIGLYGVEPGTGNVGPIPQLSFKLTRKPPQVISHYHHIPNNPAFSTRKLLKQVSLGENTDTLYTCADGSKSSIFFFTGGDIDYSSVTVNIAEDQYNDSDRYGSFEIIGQSESGLEVRYKHAQYVPISLKYVDLHISLTEESGTSHSNIMRVLHAPIVLVHGFASNSDGFQLMRSTLVKSGAWPDELIYLADYESNSKSHFSVNGLVVPKGITAVISKAISKGYSAGKASIVGHSMGGILTRKYLQDDTEAGSINNYRDDIYKIITLNTPHSGSQFANIGFDLSWNPLYLNNIRNLLLLAAQKWVDNGAVTDLAVGSDAIKRLNSPEYLNKHTAPSHAIITTIHYEGDAPVNTEPMVLRGLETGISKLLNINLNQAYGENHDFVVPVSSQMGGLNGPAISTIINQGHAGSMENPSVIGRTLILLLTPVIDATFYKRGYSPPELTYTKTFRLYQTMFDQRKVVENASVKIDTTIKGKIIAGGESLIINASGKNLSSISIFVSYRVQSDSMYTGHRLGNEANIPILVDRAAGRRTIIAIGKTEEGEYVSDTSYFYVSNSLCKSIKSGPWESPDTWSCGHEPTYTDDANINKGHTITIISDSYTKRLINEGKLEIKSSIALNLSGIPPGALELSGNFTFKQIVVGQTVTRTMVIKNIGSLPITIKKITLPAGFSGSWSGTLASGVSHSVEISFKATLAGSFSETLVVSSFPAAVGHTIKTSGLVVENSLGLGLAIYFPFSGNPNDASGNGNHGILNGPTLTTDRFGNLNQAYSFIRSAQNYISVPNSPDLDITGSSLSICAWIKPNWEGSSINMQIVSKALDPVNRKFGVGTDGPRRMNFELRTNNGTTDQQWNCAECNLDENVWQFVSLTYDGSSMKWYKNGTLLYEFPKTGLIVSTNSDLIIGSFADRAQSRFNGSLDEIRIYNRAITENEIKSLFLQ